MAEMLVGTITVAVIGVPLQVCPPLVNEGVIVKDTVIGEPVVLTSEPPMLFPVPPDAIPLTSDVWFLVQLYTVPVTLPVSAIALIAPPQVVCDEGVATALGVGFTVMVKVLDGPVQLAVAL